MDDSAGIKLLANAAWIDANWMWVGLLLGAINFVCLMKYKQSICNKFGPQVWYGLIASSVYAIHQVEEHGYDIYGRRYMFVPTLNEKMAKLGVVLTPRATTYVNLIAIWIAFPVCAYISNKGNNYIPAAITWGTAILNGIGGHLLPLFQKEYVPGAFQSALMVPFGIWVLSSYHFRFGWIDGLILPLIAGVLFHVVGIIFPVFFFPGFELMVPLFIIIASIGLPAGIGKMKQE